MTRQQLGRIDWRQSGYIDDNHREPIHYCTGYCACGLKQTMTEDQINEFNQNCIGLSLNVPKPRISKVQRAIFLLKNFTRLKLVVKVDKEETPIINAHGNLHYKNRYDTL